MKRFHFVALNEAIHNIRKCIYIYIQIDIYIYVFIYILYLYIQILYCSRYKDWWNLSPLQIKLWLFGIFDPPKKPEHLPLQPVRLQLPLQVTSFYSQKLESGRYSSQAEKESSSENRVCVKEASKKRNPKNPSWTKVVWFRPWIVWTNYKLYILQHDFHGNFLMIPPWKSLPPFSKWWNSFWKMINLT